MAFSIRPFTEADAKEVAGWRYEPPYHIYNFDGWDKALADGSSLTRPETRAEEYYALEENGKLAGFFRLIPKDDYIMLAVGLSPRLCGMGRSGELLALVQEAYQGRYSGLPLRLEVRTFNHRAKRAYEKAGFRVLREYERTTPSGRGDFYLMEWDPA